MNEYVRRSCQMKIGIIGLPQTGKTTLFGALTRGTTQVSQSKTNLAAVGVADTDLDYLASVFKPKKTTPASVEFADVPGIPSGQENASRRNELLKDVKNVEALVEVFDAFTQVPSATNLRDQIENFELDLALVDLEIVEHRLERMKKEKMTPVLERERDLLSSAQSCLSGGKGLRSLGLSDEDKSLLTSYAFITLKPVMHVINITMTDETAARNLEAALTAADDQVDATAMVLDAKLEREIAELPAAEQLEFLQEFGLSGSVHRQSISAAQTRDLLHCGRRRVQGLGHRGRHPCPGGCRQDPHGYRPWIHCSGSHLAG